MDLPITGGCVCSAVRYECSAEPIAVAHCYCTDCQKTSGAQMSTNVLVPKAAFAVTMGQSKSFDTMADSGNTVSRHFCVSCGTNLWSVPNGIPGLLVIKIGTVDSAASLRPGMSIYCASKQPWAVVEDIIPQFEKMPPA